ncbi:hypothetical protein pb186bvf_008762 [Paramecium bursaria]
MLPIHNHEGHKHKKGKSFLHNKSFSTFVLVFTVMMPTNCVILEFFVFDIELEGFDYKLQTFALFFIYIMAMFSYYQAVTINNDTIPKPPPPADNRPIDPNYKNTAHCIDCNRWKPVRTHHCSMCGKCNSRMDHHCPWIANCVGLRNHRSFYLFTMYMMFGGLQYSWRSWVYFQKLYYSDNFFQNSVVFYLFWTFTNVVLYPTAAMLGFLFGYHSYLILQNQTTLEGMKAGSQQGCVPNKKDDRLISVNVFDRGWIANVAWFFEYSYFWWIPFESVHDNDGTSFPMLPLCTVEDFKRVNPDFVENDKDQMNERIDFNKMDEKYLDYLEAQKQQYKGKKIQLHDRVITVE